MMAKEVEDITVSTEQYYVYQYNQDQNIDNKKDEVKKKIWRGTQVLSLKSKSSEALLTLIGKLQNEGLLIQSLNYTLSNEKKRSHPRFYDRSCYCKTKATSYTCS